MSQLSLYLFGAPHLERDGTSLAVDTRKAIALLAYLAVTGQSHGRDTLAALLWPDYDQSRARAALRRTLSTLNTVMDGEGLNIEREAIGLEQNSTLWIDVAQFQRLLAECRSHPHPAEAVCPACLPLLTEAVALYRADFMAGFSLRDSPDFDDWQFFQSESLRQVLAGALEKLVKGYAARAEFELAIAYTRRWLALDPLHEPAQRQLIQLYALSGQRSAALRQYRECVRVLTEELGASPEVETTALVQAIEEGRFPPPQVEPEQWGTAEYKQDVTAAPQPEPTAPAAQPVGPPLTPVPLHNLPAQTGPFVGREVELKELARLLVEPNCRLITLIGPGGIGKTRLVLQVALGHLADFADGVFFIPLASLDSAELLVPAIARILGFNFYGSTPPETQLYIICGIRRCCWSWIA
jgi:DNA-binding SARP family transcriptional activator